MKKQHKNSNLSFIVSLTFALLTIPFVAMQITPEVDWEILDFILAGILLLGTGLLLDRIASRVLSGKVKILIILFVLTLFVLVWMELAVGLFGTPFAGS